MSVAEVILDLALDRPLDYRIPPDMSVEVGMRVEVPVRGKPRKGTVFLLKEKSQFAKLQSICSVTSDSPHITPDLFRLSQWVADYYCAPLSKVLKALLPASVRGTTQHKQQLFVRRAKSRDALIEVVRELRGKREQQAKVLDAMLPVTGGLLLTELMEIAGVSRSPVDSLVKLGLLKVETVQIDRDPLRDLEVFRTSAKKLLPEQEQALSKVRTSLDTSTFSTHLLYGVTGSGKTEVYLQAIDHALSQGKGSIMLVPEIALTAQTIQRFRARFQEKIAVLHCRLSQGERFDEWHRIHRGESQIVVGARSAIFSPVKNLGLIIVDEEHEPTYKQTDEAPCYHARDVAVMRAHFTQSTVILGSATPSLETFYNAKSGKYQLSIMKQRPGSAVLPAVQIVNMKREFEKAQGYTNFSEPLLNGIQKRMECGEQTILFLNRRGYHSSLLCQSCQTAVQCPHCDVALTFHRSEAHLACHLCSYLLSPPPKRCPGCGSDETMKFRGVGTEQVERSLKAVFPEVRTLRMDADTTRHKGSHEKLLTAFRSGKADVLIGTQMIAKGLHFPEVTLVGVLNSDSALNIPDFRASERVYQLITQVAGRSGRGELPGEVVIQTHMPDNGTICHAANQEYEPFYEEEVAVREMFAFPPFGRFAKYLFSGKDPLAAENAAGRMRNALLRYLPKDFELFPVQPAGHAKVKDRFRFQFLAKGPAIAPLNRAYHRAIHEAGIPSSVRHSVDIDPMSTYF